jgi:hypothetical protein
MLAQTIFLEYIKIERIEVVLNRFCCAGFGRFGAAGFGAAWPADRPMMSCTSLRDAMATESMR